MSVNPYYLKYIDDRMTKIEYQAYGDLAWTETIVAPPEKYIEETEPLCTIIKEQSALEVKTLLHLGCGAGGNDYTFKQHFSVTGVDISDDMLKIARDINPGVRYIQGDMRNVKLMKHFDAIVIPDSIDYMVTIDDLRKTIKTAHNHLKQGGLLVITASIKEEFRENNFVYSGKKGNTEITIFENNYIPEPDSSTYESTIVYLIRKNGKLELYSDQHILGLFELKTWVEVFRENGFEVSYQRAADSYTEYIMEDGEYPRFLFICKKTF